MGQPESRIHIPALDGVRGVAILMVLLFHGGAQVLPNDSSALGGLRQLLTYGSQVGAEKPEMPPAATP